MSDSIQPAHRSRGARSDRAPSSSPAPNMTRRPTAAPGKPTLFDAQQAEDCRGSVYYYVPPARKTPVPTRPPQPAIEIQPDGDRADDFDRVDPAEPEETHGFSALNDAPQLNFNRNAGNAKPVFLFALLQDALGWWCQIYISRRARRMLFAILSGIGLLIAGEINLLQLLLRIFA